MDAVREADPGHGGSPYSILVGLRLRRSNGYHRQRLRLSACVCRRAVSRLSSLVTVYRPGSAPMSTLFFDELPRTCTLQAPMLYGIPAVIGGDLNIHMEDLHDEDAVTLTSLFDTVDIRQHAAVPTHRMRGHRILSPH